MLEEPWHLSYPFLIEHDGDLWMIPESSAHNDVPLYKCVRFPDKWERHSTLLSGFELADATITQHNGLNYMFGAWRDGTAGYSDVLAIYLCREPVRPLAAACEQSDHDGPGHDAAGGKFRHHRWQDCGGRCRIAPTAMAQPSVLPKSSN